MSYIIRALSQPDEIPSFIDHLGLVFGVPKPNGSPGAPRSHFLDHWELDPDHKIEGVFVSEAKGDGEEQAGQQLEIASSVRVYHRVMSVSPSCKISVGAIGDVATKVKV